VSYASASAISGVCIPPGLFSQSAYGTLHQGGDFTADQGTDLVFSGTTNIIMNNTTNEFLTGFLVSGYTSGAWSPISGSNIVTGRVFFKVTAANSLTFNLLLTYINGGQATANSSGYANPYVASVAMFYL
jgi:hypothetical protein